MTKAEEVALRAKICERLGLGPDGMCPTKTPVLSRALNQRMDQASLSIMSAAEVDACAVQDVAPRDYIIARGVSTQVMQQAPQRNIPSRDNSGNDPMFDLAVESLANYSGSKNRDHLFYAQAAIARMIKNSR